jgi:hypothetical protein
VPTNRDDSQCPKSCGVQPPNDFNLVACQNPFQSTQKAKQNYTFTCDTTTGQYNRIATGGIDYTGCPKSCTGVNPAVRQVIACPAGKTGTAYQNYSSECNTVIGEWTTPVETTKDFSGCVDATCSGAPPTNFDPVACPAPFQSRLDAKKMYSNSTCVGGAWQRGSPTGVIDTSSCPVNDCSGSPNPGDEKDISACPGGATGRVYQTCTLACTGVTYSQINCSVDNYSRCDCGANATFSVVTRTCVAIVPTYTYAWDPDAITYGACSAVACGTSGTKPGTFTTCRRNDGAIVAGSFCGSDIAPPANCSAPACGYTYSPINIQYGSCSAIACGTNGSQPVTSYQCQRNDGTIVANSFCVAPQAQPCSAVGCASYSCQGPVPGNASLCAGDDQNLSSDFNNVLAPSCTAAMCEYLCNSGAVNLGGSCQTCNASNASAWYLEVNTDVKAAGVDALTHWCAHGKNEGRASCFQDSQCPKKCDAGTIDVQSEANNIGTKTTCTFDWSSANAGQPAVITRATNGGTLSGLCDPAGGGGWTSVASSCPKPADAGCTNGATNYPACNNRSCTAGTSAGGILCIKICKGISVGHRTVNGYIINTVATGTHMNQTNITTGVAGTHFHPVVNYYGFNCNDGQVSFDNVPGHCEYHVDQLGRRCRM